MPPQDLLIVGAGGASLQIAEAVEDINRAGARWNLLGFLDDDPGRQGKAIHGYPVLGPTSSAATFPSCRFIIGIASHRAPFARRTVAERMAIPLERFVTIVHPSAVVSAHARLGAGTAIFPYAVIGHDSTIGNHVLLSSFTYVGHDALVEDYVTTATAAVISGSVRLRRGAYLGARSVLLQNLEVGEGALVGIGAVVVRDVPAATTVFGSPAKPLRRLRRPSGGGPAQGSS